MNSPDTLLRHLVRKLRLIRARYGYVRRMTHPAFAHILLDAPVLPVERLVSDAPVSDRLLERICTHYVRASCRFRGSGESLWTEQESARGAFIAALERGDTAYLRAAFRDLFGSTLLDGMSHGNSLFANAERNPYTGDFISLRTTDCLLSLAEARGIRRVPAYAHMKLPAYVNSLHDDPGDLLRLIEDDLGFSLEMPAVGAPYICRVGDQRAIAPDILRHGYVASRIGEFGLSPDSRILEIGGGFGMLALCAFRAGYRDYTIVDLPFVGAIQMAYLGATLGEDVVSGEGEPSAPVRVCAPESISDIADDTIGLTINCDSLPEIAESAALDYVRQIQRVGPRFLSINQETQAVYNGFRQNRVACLVDRSGEMRRTARYRSWMEQGYVEEVYERACARDQTGSISNQPGRLSQRASQARTAG